MNINWDIKYRGDTKKNSVNTLNANAIFLLAISLVLDAICFPLSFSLFSVLLATVFALLATFDILVFFSLLPIELIALTAFFPKFVLAIFYDNFFVPIPINPAAFFTSFIFTDVPAPNSPSNAACL